MKISLKWINDFVDVTEYLEKPEPLAELLTKAGLEVEDIQNKSKDFNQVVVGLILEKEKHPNADKLSLCKVTTGEGVVHQIVCGAQNHKQNDRIVVALPGAILPGDFKIKNSTIRGVDSAGMLCSLKELGLAETSDGLLILPSDAPLGKNFAEYYGLDDVHFELKVTPNRADCLSHYGLAREIACLTGKPLKKMNIEYTQIDDSTKKKIDLVVSEPELCPRYTGRFFDQVKVTASPDWLKKRLDSIGVKSINNVVDITNYVMHELGQPLHAFDSSEIKGSKITVKKATAGQKFTTLDGTEISFKEGELLICDQERAVALAGVVGGKNSGISDSSSSVFLEAAFFSPMSVRKTSRQHGINTDSSYRFSRGVDPDSVIIAMNRASQLLVQLAGARAYSDPFDFYPAPVKKSSIKISTSLISERLGYSAQTEKLNDFLIRLGCQVEKNGDHDFKIVPPTFRFDLESEMDIVEEYARMNGYEHIPEMIPETKLSPASHDKNYVFTQKTVSILTGLGFSQAMNFAFVNDEKESSLLGRPEVLEKLNLQLKGQKVKLLNPLNEEINVMRSILLTGLLKNVVSNFHYGNQSGQLFEIGTVFSKLEPGVTSEGFRLGFVKWGFHPQMGMNEPIQKNVFALKNSMEQVYRKLNIGEPKWIPLSAEQVPVFCHPTQILGLEFEGKWIGYCATLHPSLGSTYKISDDVAIAEFNFDLLIKNLPKVRKIQPISKMPRVERDLALLMKNSLLASDILAEAKKAAGPHLKESYVFDVFNGENLGKDMKSMALRFIFQDNNATLQDEAIQQSMNHIVEQLKQKFSVTLR